MNQLLVRMYRPLLRIYQFLRSDRMSDLENQWNETLRNVNPPPMDEFHMQCIYRVPRRIRGVKPAAYTPKIVSIGPYHRSLDLSIEDKSFWATKEFKVTYVREFLNRTELRMRELIARIEEMQNDINIRSCYEGIIECNDDDFFDMILVDACFIIELFLRWNERDNWVTRDPLMSNEWMIMQIKHDLMKLENQLPFSALEHLYIHTVMRPGSPPFREICFNYFRRPSFRPVCPRENPEQFTDLVRSSIISSSLIAEFHLRGQVQGTSVNLFYTASQLEEAGLKFRVSQNNCLLDLQLPRYGVLSMPILTINASTELYFRNMMAYEHCHRSATKIITQYVTILDFLINTEKDVDILVDKQIIVNNMGDANKVVTMINHLNSTIKKPDFCPHYLSICTGLNEFCENRLNWIKALIKHEYFSTPVKIASSSAAIVLLLLTLGQTICSIISLRHSW